jgi:hypothetical protein
MTRSSRNRARVRNNRGFPRRRRGSALGSNDLMSRRDMIVPGGYVNNSGAQTAAQGWNGTAVVLTPGSQLAWQAIVIPTAITANNAPPSIGECQIDFVDASVFLTTPTVAGIYFFGMGIYISKYDTRTGTWGVRNPTNTGADAGRDDWLQLKVMVATLPLPAAVTDPMMLELKFVLPHPVILGGGEALHLCVDNNTSSVGSISTYAFIRSRIADVT